MPERLEVVAAVAEFVRLKHPARGAHVDADTALFQQGLLDSFTVVELAAALSARFNMALNLGQLLPEDFETPTVLHARLVEVAS